MCHAGFPEWNCHHKTARADYSTPSSSRRSDRSLASDAATFGEHVLHPTESVSALRADLRDGTDIGPEAASGIIVSNKNVQLLFTCNAKHENCPARAK